MTPLIFVVLGNEATTEELILALDVERGTTTMRCSPDEEPYVRVESAVGGRQVATACTLDQPDDELVPLLLLAAAVRENSVTGVDPVTPYLAYMRQDSYFQPGKTVNARYFAAWLSRGFDQLATADPHLHRITKLSQVYIILTHHVHAAPAMMAWLHIHVARPVLVDPNEESNQRVADTASRADAPMTALHKVRKGDRNAEVSVPNVERWCDHTLVLVDDTVSTGRTMAEIVGHLRHIGLAAPVRIVTYAVFSGNAIQDLESAGIGLVVSCDTVVYPTSEIPAAPDLASAVRELMQDPGGAT